MSINLNFNKNPESKLSFSQIQNSKCPFEKFTNPQNSAKLSLKEFGTVILKKRPELSSLELNDLYSERLSCQGVPLITLVDPNAKLKLLLEEKEIAQICANCPVDQAQVILIDDVNHSEKKKQSLIRGKIANILKGDKNIYLCEEKSPSKIDFNQEEINYYFAPNLELEGTENYFSGWDDTDANQKGFEIVRQIFEKMKASNSFSSSPSHLNSEIQDLERAVEKIANWRTQVLSNAIKETHELFPDAKIIVFGGKDHLQDKYLHEQLTYQNLRFVEITPIGEATFDSQEQLFNRCYDYYVRDMQN